MRSYVYTQSNVILITGISRTPCTGIAIHITKGNLLFFFKSLKHAQCSLLIIGFQCIHYNVLTYATLAYNTYSCTIQLLIYFSNVIFCRKTERSIHALNIEYECQRLKKRQYICLNALQSKSYKNSLCARQSWIIAIA